ncbi:MAG: 3'(2'),5'-bisphosphate nucleotidase CysQ family protein [Wolinella sp.]
MNEKELLERAKEVALRAGEAILAHYGTHEFTQKSDRSPLTLADKASHELITSELGGLYPVFSEEAILPYEERKDFARFWLVDPLDGTKEFLAQNGEFVVSIALIEHQRPILGVLYAPVSGDLYHARRGAGAHKNTQPLKNARAQHLNSALSSRSHKDSEFESFCAKHNFSALHVGSALKFAILSEGRAGIYPRFHGSSTWDIAAGDIILKESGGIVIDLVTKKEPLYNQESHRNNHFIAFSSEIFKQGIEKFLA